MQLLSRHASVHADAAIAFAAVLEYMCAELAELGGNVSRDKWLVSINSRVPMKVQPFLILSACSVPVIIAQFISMAISDDSELLDTFRRFQVCAASSSFSCLPQSNCYREARVGVSMSAFCLRI